ncbi:hypothetical protein SISSUDRAFT_1059731 [Sistotremastrum suecicum HHB10207 ss-3]|uniref:ATPase AAA-type core domain-containing protein n=1 Tax=Sistotremastrum suecicum HHB10207 ss-3 TaxID=1314776 RepID=A0A166G030_9AGAM|nr:hypothetical protein SISSUDRAFT_1059731 [Sistotremastrum suecicum HHB10207 ss-3]
MPKKKSGLPEAPKESKPARKRQASGQQNLRAFFKVKSSPAEEVAVDVVDAVDGSGAEEKPSAVEESAEVVPAQPPPPSSGGLNWGASGSNSRFSSPQPDVNQFASSDGPPITELSSSSPAAIVITPSSPIATSSNDGRMSPSILSISSENFASSSKNPPPPPPSNPSTQSSVHEPIVIDDGSDDDEVVVLMPQRRDKRPVKTIHPFFARKATNPKPLDPSPPSPEKFRGRKPPSLPVEGSQHIRGSQNTFDAPALPIKRRATRPKRGHLTLLDEKLPRLTGEATSLSFEDQPTDFRLRACNDLDEDDIERYLGYVPAKHLNLPAFKRFDDHLQSPDPPQPSSETWADKWRPRAAEQVLFNELNALYLKAWLQTLSLQLESRDSKSAQGLRSDPRGDGQMARGSKRPAVIRSVHRQKGRKRLKRNPYDEEDDEDDWIVDDDEVEDSWIGEGDDVDEFIFSRPVPPSDLPESTPVDDRPPDEPSGPQSLPTQPQFVPGQSHLTNTILLSGPSGSGKTAAVYACAEELGWEVFEVYPGIGKRSGANLSSLVGDVAKNHLVNNRGPSGTSNSISTLLGTSDKRTEKSRADANPSGSVRQSIILLEEVDILFNEDINFWPSVVKLIADSRRPVIMTCNGMSLF